MEPSFAKAYYRRALGHAMARDFPRAKHDLRDGLKKCPDNAALKQMMDELDNLGVPDHFANPFCDAAEEANEKVENGAPYGACVFCRRMVPLPVEGNCPFCIMNLETDIEEQVLITFILNH